MAVPKRKTTPSKRKMRRSHDSLPFSNLIECSNCGELKLSHQICLACGFYSKREVILSEDISDTEE
ncbi:MAG: 50S ribosomal protein L32 [Rickettsiales bacterium]|nr:50S ribosomal protein L32 [Rickettsiales bacterium]|tara:strand:+ start:1199 stop:1396 length:198 start_codon:yes stop_codon:yes gene_type:complete